MTNNNKIKYPIISPYHLEGICETIASTSDGLTGSEISKILVDCGIDDYSPDMKKSKRLYNAFVSIQNNSKCSNKILNFLSSAMQPSRYLGKDNVFHQRLNDLNKSLSFIGLEMSHSAKFKKTTQATTLSEAQQRANSFKSKLQSRNVHHEIIRFCDAELLVENYFHSIFEATKSVAERIRNMTGVYADGIKLVEVVFQINNPLIKINLLRNETDRSEHYGLANLIKSIFGLIRNPTAHTPKIKFIIEEEEAIDLMSLISFAHKKLDKSI